MYLNLRHSKLVSFEIDVLIKFLATVHCPCFHYEKFYSSLKAKLSLLSPTLNFYAFTLWIVSSSQNWLGELQWIKYHFKWDGSSLSYASDPHWVQADCSWGLWKLSYWTRSKILLLCLMCLAMMDLGFLIACYLNFRVLHGAK